MGKVTKKITENSFIVPIFNQKIVIITGNWRDVKSWFNRNNVSFECNSNADGACFGIDDKIYIWFEPNPTINIVVHEIAHSVFAIMESRGLDIEDEELFCYLQEFIIDNVLKCVKVMLPIAMDRINQK